MKNHISIIALCLTLTGCGGKMAYDRMVNMDDMEASKAAYKQCMVNNNGSKSACAGEKAAYDADLQAYAASSKSTQPTVNLNVQKNTDQ